MKKIGPVHLPQIFRSDYDKRLSVMLYQYLTEIATQVNALIDEVQKVEYALRYDYVDATTSYRAEGLPGSAESAAAWRIQRLTFAGDDVTVEWADGNARFDNVWDDRASLSYS